MFRRMIIVMALSLLALLYSSPAFADNRVTILCYHDVGKVNNDYTISRENLQAQFNYLKQNGYTPISLTQYIEASANKGPLPDKPVLITFDDGYVSFYNEVYPLLKQYQYPAVLAVVTYWQTAQKPADVGQLVTWQQMREMEQSGLVAIASHSHNLHHGIVVNSFGDRGEAGSALVYRDGKNEALETYKARIAKDLEENQKIFERELGHKVEAIVWPYGEYTLYGVEIARSLGFKAAMGLGGRYNEAGTEKGLLEARRGLIYMNPDLQHFAKMLTRGGNDDPPLRAAWVNTDLIYDPVNPRQTDANVRALMDRYQRLGINTVFLQAYSDPNGDGNIASVYFSTSVAPVKAPVFDHIARKFRAEGIYVYALMPTLAGQWLIKNGTEAVDAVGGSKGFHKRATPFSDDVRKSLRTLYSDLSIYSFLDGVVFQDDLFLNSDEDFSPAAKQAFSKQFGHPLTPEILKNPQIATDWSNLKVNTLNELTVELMDIIRQFKPYTKFVRSIYPEVVFEKNMEQPRAQNYSQFMAMYDYTLIGLNPHREKQSLHPPQWVSELAATAMKQPGAADKLIIEVTAYDWGKKRWLLDNELKDYIKVLREKGVTLFGFYPDAVFNEKSALLPK